MDLYDDEEIQDTLTLNFELCFEASEELSLEVDTGEYLCVEMRVPNPLKLGDQYVDLMKKRLLPWKRILRASGRIEPLEGTMCGVFVVTEDRMRVALDMA